MLETFLRRDVSDHWILEQLIRPTDIHAADNESAVVTTYSTSTRTTTTIELLREDRALAFDLPIKSTTMTAVAGDDLGLQQQSPSSSVRGVVFGVSTAILIVTLAFVIFSSRRRCRSAASMSTATVYQTGGSDEPQVGQRRRRLSSRSNVSGSSSPMPPARLLSFVFSPRSPFVKRKLAPAVGPVLPQPRRKQLQHPAVSVIQHQPIGSSVLSLTPDLNQTNYINWGYQQTAVETNDECPGVLSTPLGTRPSFLPIDQRMTVIQRHQNLRRLSQSAKVIAAVHYHPSNGGDDRADNETCLNIVTRGESGAVDSGISGMDVSSLSETTPAKGVTEVNRDNKGLSLPVLSSVEGGDTVHSSSSSSFEVSDCLSTESSLTTITSPTSLDMNSRQNMTNISASADNGQVSAAAPVSSSRRERRGQSDNSQSVPVVRSPHPLRTSVITPWRLKAFDNDEHLAAANSSITCSSSNRNAKNSQENRRLGSLSTDVKNTNKPELPRQVEKDNESFSRSNDASFTSSVDETRTAISETSCNFRSRNSPSVGGGKKRKAASACETNTDRKRSFHVDGEVVTQQPDKVEEYLSSTTYSFIDEKTPPSSRQTKIAASRDATATINQTRRLSDEESATVSAHPRYTSPTVAEPAGVAGRDAVSPTNDGRGRPRSQSSGSKKRPPSFGSKRSPTSPVPTAGDAVHPATIIAESEPERIRQLSRLLRRPDFTVGSHDILQVTSEETASRKTPDDSITAKAEFSEQHVENKAFENDSRPRGHCGDRSERHQSCPSRQFACFM